jgi:DNA repair protein RecO (recombination protein O)
MRVSLVSAAIVLRARPFGESDKIISFFTQDYGKLTGIAKGAMRSRKRFANSLEPFSLINLSFQDRSHSNLAFVLSAELLHSPWTLMNHLDRIAHASYLVEITDGLIGEHEANAAIFQHLKDGLSHLEVKGPSLRFLTFFELKLLRLAGYQPVLDTCKKCRESCLDGAQSRWHFSPVDGGVLCEGCSRSCREVLPLGKTAVEILTALQAESDSLPAGLSLPASVVAEIRSVILRFIQFQMDREIKSAPFLHQFSQV